MLPLSTTSFEFGTVSPVLYICFLLHFIDINYEIILTRVINGYEDNSKFSGDK